MNPSPPVPVVGPAATPDTAPAAAAPPVTSPPTFFAVGFGDLRTTAQARAAWLWHGYLAPGNVTLLTSQWKSGKTTLVAVLLARLKAGGLFAGLPLRPGRAVVVSEESPGHWVGRGQKLDLDGHVWWLCRPFRGRPTREQWLALVEYLAALGTERGLDLVVLDPLASFLPGHGENNAGAMLDVLLPLQRLTTLGLSVLVLHHPKKGEAAAGQAARGSGALSGYVDILIEMGWHGRPSEDDRRRRLLAYSRHRETPRRRVLELTADGTDYVSRGDVHEDEFDEGWQVLRGVLEDAAHKLTRREVLRQWPQDFRAPDETTLWRWLDRAVNDGRVRRDGSGRKNAPFRYWLPGQEEKWASDPFRLPDLGPLGELNAAAFGAASRRRKGPRKAEGPDAAPAL